MASQVYECAEIAGGCGVVWTPIQGNRRPIKHQPEWRWCPDCIRAGVPDSLEGETDERRAARR